MIKLLHIENVAVIEKADIEFSSGLNVLTGETGAGKSIVIDSLSAVTGNRTSRELIRTGAEFASVTAVFSGMSNGSWLVENGIEQDESGDVFITRRISSDGKSVCRINGTPVSVASLREFGGTLIDIHGQNDGQKLLDEGAHLAYLDVFGRLEKELEIYKESYKKLKAKEDEIQKHSMNENEKQQRIDSLKYQIDEISKAKLRAGEQDELTSRRELLLNASKLTDAVETAFEALYGGEETAGVVGLIDTAHNQLDRASQYAEGLRSLSERLNDLRYTAQDISEELRDFRGELDFSAGELDEIEERLNTLKRITRKYGSEEEAIAHMEQGQAELLDLEDSTNKLAKLEKELTICVAATTDLATKLSEKRQKAAKTLQSRVKDELSQLNMPGVAFAVEFEKVSDKHGLCATGCDEVFYLMSANAGEKPGRINRIASGGELARIMLALKNVLMSEQDGATMVFDEIDTGVSGIAAQRVGEKLVKLANERQVLCVTHLPQIAVMADTHLRISKSISKGRTFTQVDVLDFEGRKKELAYISGGENITDTTLASVGEQLKAAEEFKKNRKFPK